MTRGSHAHRRPTGKSTVVALAALLATGAAPAIASAADIDTITLTAAGPNKTVPIDAAFYLAGTVDSDITRVQALIVRTGSDWLWPRTKPKPCTELVPKLTQFVDDPRKSTAQLPLLQASDTTADKIWVGGDPDWMVRITPPWLPPETKPGAESKTNEFKILIDRDGDFFSAGHSYCYFVYQNRTTTRQDTAIAAKLLQAIDHYLDGCDFPSGATCGVDFRETNQLIDALPERDRPAIVDARNKAAGVAAQLGEAARRAGALLTHWDRALKPSTVPAYVGVTTALGRAIAVLLIKNHKLASAPNGYEYDNGAKHAVAAISFDADGKLGFAASTSGAMPVALDGSSTDYKVPGSTTSLRDLYELSQGRLPSGKGYVVPAALLATLAQLLGNRATAFTPEQDRLYSDAHDGLVALDQTLHAIHQVHTRSRAAPGSEAAILWDLGEWLDTEVEAPCDLAVERIWGVLPTPCHDRRLLARVLVPWLRLFSPLVPWTTLQDGWESYDTPQGFPTSRLVQALETFHDAHQKWIEQRPSIPSSITTTTTVTRPFAANIDVTRDVWVFSYLSPVVGYALALPQRSGASEAVELHYFAVQLHARPNPAHLPRLDAGVVALELGASPGIGSFGPDNRFRGLSNIAPVFLGVGLHLIPFTSISAGYLFAEKRSSTLTQEPYSTFATPYVGLTVDLNLPELVWSQTGKTSTTTASPGK